MPKKSTVAIGLIWLFHISGIIGIFLGYKEWFLVKTPLNLLVSFTLLLVVGPIHFKRHSLWIFFFFIAGMFVEWVGVTTGFPFGIYYYGDNLGPKLDGVPFMIGVNWAMLILITGTLANKISSNNWLKILIGASMMVFLDFFIEPNASNFDFWHWANDTIPPENYMAWFIISALLHGVFQKTIQAINHPISLHLYLAQVLFFSSFLVYGNL